MTRLIDADAIEKVLEEKHFKRVLDSDRWLIADIKKSIMDLPTVDAVEVIRCKDCEDCTETKLYDGQRWNYCMRLRCVVKENDFCCWAERKYLKIKAKETNERHV